jgi:GntR family transcriptional regulator
MTLHSAHAMSDGTGRLYLAIRSLIETEMFVPGDRLGTERELALRLAVGRNLLRQALTVLEREGRIRRIIGRSGGIYVSDGKVERVLNSIVSVPTMLRSQGFVAETQVISAAITIADPHVARALNLNAGDHVVVLKRLRYADGKPLSFETTHLPSALFPRLLTHSLDLSLYALMASEYGIHPVIADEGIEARSSTRSEETTLGLECPGVVFEIRRVAREASGRPVEFASDVFRADRTRINVVARDMKALPPRVADPKRRIH